MKYCTKCGIQNNDECTVCSQCGTQLMSTDTVSKTVDEPFGEKSTKKNRGKLYGIIAAVAIIAVVILSFLSANSDVVKTIEITSENELLYCNEATQLSACVTAEGDDVTSKTKLVWKSSNPDIASVDENGSITGIAAGTATITASLKKDSSVKDDIEITVGAHVEAITINTTQVELLADTPLAIGQISYSIIPENAYCQDVVMCSSDENVAIVDADGNIHAVAPGSATITVSSADEACTQSASCEVIVKQGVKEVILNHSTSDLYLGENFTLTAEVAPENAENPTLVWKSSDEAVATVSDTGEVSAIGVGSAAITCNAQDGSGVGAVCTVTVVKPVEKIELAETSLILLVGASKELSEQQLNCIVTPDDATYQTAIWTSSDEAVATVDENGIVKGIGSGKATITARTAEARGSETIFATCNVTVGNAVQNIDFVDIDTNIAKNTTKKVKLQITPENVHNSKLVWTSSDESILKVDSSGNVRAVGVGKAQITCTATDGSNVSHEETFNVYQPVTSLKAEETGTIVIFEDKDITLHATAAPSDATDKSVEWSSDNPDVATVDSSGCVTGEGKGTAVITATAKDGSGRKCTFRVCVEPAVPVTVESLGFGVYNGNLLGITVKNNCSKKAIKNFDFDIELESYFGGELDSSGSYNLGSDVYIGAGAKSTIKRTLSGISWTQKVKITITGVEFTDGTFYSIPWSKQETWSFWR